MTEAKDVKIYRKETFKSGQTADILLAQILEELKSLNKTITELKNKFGKYI